MTNNNEAQAHETDTDRCGDTAVPVRVGMLPDGGGLDRMAEKLAEQAIKNPAFDEAFKRVFGG